MTSHITVIPASTQAGKETIRVLLESDDALIVRGIYRDPSKAPAEFAGHPRFEIATGDVGSGAELDFTQSDAVFYIPPPTYDGRDSGEFATQTAKGVADALRRAPNMKRLVLHSALGAQYSHGIGVLRINHISDDILKAAAPEVIIVRPGYYYQFWADAMKTMQADPPRFESPFSPADHKIPMVSVKDVGKYCARALLKDVTKPSPQYVRLFGPRLYSSRDVKNAIEAITGREGELVVIPEDGLVDFWGKLVPEGYVQDFVALTTSQLPGRIMAGDYEYDENTVRCDTALIDDLR